MPGFVFVLDSRSGWQGEPPGGKIVVHAPREPNHARALAAGEKLIEEVVLELVTEGVAVVSSYRPAALIVRWRD